MMIINTWENNINVQNHQPDMSLYNKIFLCSPFFCWTFEAALSRLNAVTYPSWSNIPAATFQGWSQLPIGCKLSSGSFLKVGTPTCKLVAGLKPSEKYESQLGWLFQIYGKIKNVPNHQSASYWPFSMGGGKGIATFRTQMDSVSIMGRCVIPDQPASKFPLSSCILGTSIAINPQGFSSFAIWFWPGYLHLKCPHWQANIQLYHQITMFCP